MLKALELVGFKSFADKTRFEFPRGITAVVGPNGSGKSNVVDAIKWVLGEQSVKSLRGKEMADVIFNGSGSRHALNAAEATLTFDNSARLLPIDAAEIHVTRRVYRSGEGEYLINRQPCRLRDIRDLCTGTGVATEAYSVIEQGKVDVMLQASPRDRRAIFEEAAGISRFKAKKIESLRRLERVEQNLLRLSDIVDEVENRLRAVRLQASKARRYREHTDRLQELRTQVGLADWRKLSGKLDLLEAELTSLATEGDSAAAQAERIEARALELDVALADAGEAIRGSESRLAELRERIATLEATLEHQRARSRDAEEEVVRHQRQWAAMNVRAGDLAQQLAETLLAVGAAERQFQDRGETLAADERDLSGLHAQLEELRAAHDQQRAAWLESMRRAAAQATELASLKRGAEAAEASCLRSRQRLDELDETHRALSVERDRLQKAQQEQARLVDQQGAQWSAARRQLADLRDAQATGVAELASLRQRQSALAERASLLEELEQRHEGLGAGVKQVLAEARSPAQSSLRGVVGVVAELFHVNVDQAPLIEVALGDKAQYVVLEDGEAWDALARHDRRPLQGRVGFIRLAEAPANWEAERNIEELPGVVGRADHAVDTAANLAALARRLLGSVWIVESLAHAVSLSVGAGRGLTFVTLAGELLEADGSLSVGPRHASIGLISRRSELRALKARLAELADSIAQAAQAADRLEQEISAKSQVAQDLAEAHRRAADALGEQRLRVQAVETRQGQLEEQREELAKELAAAERDRGRLEVALRQTRETLAAAEQVQSADESALTALAERVAQAEAQRSAHQDCVTAAKVELAKSEERLANLRARLRQLEQDQHERQRNLEEGRKQVELARQRARLAQSAILDAGSQIAELFLRKELAASETARHVNRREAHRAERATLVADAQLARATVRKLEERRHAKDLTAGEIRHERGALADRLREDYGIELAELEHAPTDEELHEREEIEGEIAELRRKINSIGSVNLDALLELDELEERYGRLSAQFQDLTKAKDSLSQIITKINADSRRLFAETLETVKGHFQTLFRKLFGGGQADIVLEEGVDILDSGIEIVARPPGKEPRNISLLSGGEKTLTCVALLLAIFQYRPSPFCVLDEVDASLDEANIERFIGVLQEFLAWTQFIVVTHSKKTMTCASTLYGVTMEESGISKRVSVRFEDVSDDGHVRLPDPTGDETQAA